MNLTPHHRAAALDGFIADSDHIDTVAAAADGRDAPVATGITPAGVRG